MRLQGVTQRFRIAYKKPINRKKMKPLTKENITKIDGRQK